MLRAAKINGKTLSDQEFSKFELSPFAEKTEEVSDCYFFKKFLFYKSLFNCSDGTILLK
jgi:hypothetical protein